MGYQKKINFLDDSLCFWKLCKIDHKKVVFAYLEVRGWELIAAVTPFV